MLMETPFNAEFTTLELLETQALMLKYTALTLVKTELEFVEDLPQQLLLLLPLQLLPLVPPLAVHLSLLLPLL
jgi:hypothetical protein